MILTNRKYEYRRVDTATQKVSSWEASGLNLKARVVCGECNSGWMSEVDGNEAKPILRHLIADTSSRKLPIRVLISMAVFGFKTAVVADHMTVRGTPFFSKEQRHKFAGTLEIPGGVFMWFGALGQNRKGAFKSRHVIPAIPSRDDFHLYAFTYAVGHFVLQVVGAKWTRDDPQRSLRFPFIEQNPSDERFMTAFWPIGNWSSLTWPPPRYLTEDSIDGLANRWGKLNFIK